MESRSPSEWVEGIARWCLIVGGVASATWLVFSAVSTAELLTAASLYYALTASSGLVAAGAALRSDLRRSVLWAVLSLMAFATALQLVEAGTSVLYQHLRPAVAPMERVDWALLGAMGACAALVLAGLAPHFGRLLAWIREQLGPARAALVLVAWAGVSASPLRDLSGFALEIALATTFGLVALGAVVLACLSLPAARVRHLSSALEAMLGGGGTVGPLDRVAFWAAVWVTLLSAGLALLVWERHPHISDEISFLLQARYFASGALTIPGVPVPELFAAYQIDCDPERCLSVLQPGWPGLLAVGVLGGAPWMVNPILAGSNALLLHAFVRELYDNRLARVAVLLVACSPWYLFLGMSFMNHHATLTGALIGVLGTTLALRRGAPGWAALAGAGAGLTSLMRPMDGVIVALAAGLPLLFVGRWRHRLAAAALFAVGTGLLGSINLAYNFALNGNPLEFPVTSYVNDLWGAGTNNLGFGPDRGVYPLWSHMDGFPGHSPLQAVVNAALNVTALQFDLFGWATGSLLPMLLLLVWFAFRRADWLMLAWLGLINALYALYWFASGPDFAARYWFVGVVPLVVLTARGLQEIATRVEAVAAGRGRAMVAAAVVLLASQTILVFVPWRSTDKYHRYFNTGPLVREAIESGSWPPGVYLIEGANQPDYAAAMIYGSPALGTGEHVFAYDSLANSAARLREAYPDRRLFRVQGPSITGDVYRVRANRPTGP